MRSELAAIIKQEVEHVFGRKVVTSGDCIQLSAEIFEKVNFQLNSNTLRRFFGLVKTEYAPSHATLNILSSYCGFRSVDELYAVKREGTPEPQFIQQESVLNYFVKLFSQTPVGDHNNDTFLTMVRHTINFLNGNTDLIDKFQCVIAKTQSGQEFYFERLVNVDRLNGYYGNGLRYYLNEKTSPEANVLGHSLLVFRYWLTEEDNKLRKHFAETAQTGTNFPGNHTVRARHFAALIYHAHVNGVAIEETTAALFNYYISFRTVSRPISPSCSFELIVAEALTLTGHYDDALYYINTALRSYVKPGLTEESVMHALYLFQSIALFETEDHRTAELMFDRIVPSAFDFLSRKYYTVLYLNMSNVIKRKIARYDEQLDPLIDETGFSRLKHRLSKPVDGGLVLQ